jgi:hypothetical protein
MGLAAMPVRLRLALVSVVMVTPLVFGWYSVLESVKGGQV